MFKRIPLPAYMPDQSNNSGVLLEALNVYAAADGYRPIGAVEEVSDALAANFQGGASAISSAGTGYLLAGTAGGLYELTTASGAWSSLLTGLSITGRWRFAQFGDYSVAVNETTTYEIDLDGGTASAISGAPAANSVCVVGDFVVLGQAGGDILKVQWSGFRDHTQWTDGTNQAGSLVIQTGGKVQAVVGGEYGIVLQRESIKRMTRTGDPAAPFEFDEISANFGCASGGTVAQAGRTIFYYSDRGFMALEDGQVLKPIGSEKVDREFNSEVARDSLDEIYTAVDPQNKLVMWFVPGVPGTMWIYNFELDRWTRASFSGRGLFPGFTTSISLDDFSTISITDLDAATITLDDPRYQGGNPRLYLVTTSDKVGTLTGANLAAELEMGNTELLEGYNARLRGIRPIWDGTSGITLSVVGKQRLGDTGTTKSAPTYSTTGMMPVRVKGKHISTTISIASGTTWKYIQGLDFEFEKGGIR